MKLLKVMFCAAAFVLATIAASAQTLPDVKVENAQGESVSVRTFVTGKPIIISYWSVACKPCIQELNAILDNIEDWKEEADFEVMAVSVDDVRMKARAKSMATSNGWDADFICVYDANQDLKRAMNVSLTPQSYVVDASGNIVFSHSGYTPGSEHELFEKVRELSK